jgi:hypothetical protein
MKPKLSKPALKPSEYLCAVGPEGESRALYMPDTPLKTVRYLSPGATDIRRVRIVEVRERRGNP